MFRKLRSLEVMINSLDTGMLNIRPGARQR